MKLENKKALASRALCVGKNRIVFNSQRLEEVKEAITKQDIKDLVASGAIRIKEVSGRKTKIKSNSRRRAGSVKKKVKRTKTEYMHMVRRLRPFLSDLRKKKNLSSEQYHKIRREIKSGLHKTKVQLTTRVNSI